MLLTLLCLAAAVVLARRFREPASVVLWAWEKPCDLRFLPAESWVAPLMAHVHLSGDSFRLEGRKQPLQLPPRAKLLPVFRVESHGRAIAVPPADLALAITRWAAFPEVRGLQIDFDATVSERPFYSQLLLSLRRQMASGQKLSITALASWCLDDPWIAALPVDEAVPMLFRMGPDDAVVRRRLARGEDFSLPVCRSSVGWSTDERPAGQYRGRQVYLFSPGRWTKESLGQVRAEWLN